jgi:hypothetical protein
VIGVGQVLRQLKNRVGGLLHSATSARSDWERERIRVLEDAAATARRTDADLRIRLLNDPHFRDRLTDDPVRRTRISVEDPDFHTRMLVEPEFRVRRLGDPDVQSRLSAEDPYQEGKYQQHAYAALPSAVRALESRADDLSTELASRLHQNWRATRLRPDGTYGARPRRTFDEDWIAAHGTCMVDIAKMPHHELPADWQWNNQESGRVVVARILSELRAGRDPGRPRFVGHAYSEIHEQWLIRNDDATDVQLRLYPDLPEDQKALDRDVYHAGWTWSWRSFGTCGSDGGHGYRGSGQTGSHATWIKVQVSGTITL